MLLNKTAQKTVFEFILKKFTFLIGYLFRYFFEVLLFYLFSFAYVLVGILNIFAYHNIICYTQVLCI